MPGSLHKDVEEDDNYYKTFLFYVNDWWGWEWGGETIFVEDDKIHKEFPMPNTGLLFSSNIIHAGLEPTRHCRELRVTLAFKMKEIT